MAISYSHTLNNFEDFFFLSKDIYLKNNPLLYLGMSKKIRIKQLWNDFKCDMTVYCNWYTINGYL